MKPRIRVTQYGHLFHIDVGVSSEGTQFRIFKPTIIADGIPVGDIENYSDSLIGPSTNIIFEYFTEIKP